MFPFARSIPGSVSRTLIGAVLALLVGCFSGCATSEFRYTKTISTGERLDFSLVRGRVVDATGGGLTARAPIILPDQEQKQLRFIFGLLVTDDGTLQRVQIEDVSDEQPILLVDETNPELKDRQWIGRSEWFTLENPAASWVKYLGETFRVYRITATRGNGETVVLHEGSYTQGFAKAILRRLLGEDY